MMRNIIIAILICVFIDSFVSYLVAQEQVPEKAKVMALLNLLSESGKVIPDIETNSILVIDYPPNIALVEEYLKMADVSSEQVLIEARVVEVKLEKEHALGVNWSLFMEKAGAEMGQFRLGSGSGQGLQQVIPFRRPKWEPLIGEVQEPFTIGIFDENIEIVLRALTTQLKTEILSAPKVTTTNNRRAKIDVIKTIPYLEEIKEEEEESAGGTTTTTYTYTYTYADEGVNLEVMPQINPDRSITMILCPQVKEIVRWKPVLGPAGAPGVPELPETDIRMAQTKVTVREGQTLVIGGLIREKIRAGATKVPLLGDIPLLGSCFRTKKDEKQKVELLILVSPTIITPQVLTQMVKQERYGPGRSFLEEREADAQRMLDLEVQEKLSRDKAQDIAMQGIYRAQQQTEALASQMTLLEEKQRALKRERENLEAKVSDEERSLESLKKDEEKIIEERRQLEKQ